MKKPVSLKITGIPDLLAQIRSVISTARNTAYRASNHAMVQAYWNIGRIIVEKEQRGKSVAEYGDAIIDALSRRLTNEFGSGFDSRNLRYMRQFYLVFPIRNAVRSKSARVKISEANIWNALRSGTGKLQAGQLETGFIVNTALNPDLTWTHYRLLLKVENPDARDFYTRETVESNWSTRSLERQIGTLYYERILSSRDKKPVRKEAIKNTVAFNPRDFIKDPYVLEFLALKENRKYLESDLEQALIDKLEEFILEMGNGFAFIARQKRFTADGDHFYVDLVFYNYRLRCFFIIDLKTGKLTHQDIGQMDMYVRWFEENEKSSGDNPTIGLILCSEKKETVAHYSILKESRQIFASQYRTYLPSEKQLREELQRERLQIEQESMLRTGVKDTMRPVKKTDRRKGASK